MSRNWDRLSGGLLLALALVVAATFRDYGLSWDEPFHIEYGARLLRFYASWGADRSAFDYINLYLYGGLFDAPVALLSRWLPFGLIDNRHLLIALSGLLGIGGVWRLARLLAGPRAGFMAALLLATMPGWYGHMFINPKDVPFAAAMIWATYFLACLARELPRPRWRHLAAFGLCAGAAMGLRIGGVLSFVYLGVTVVLWWALAWRRLSAGGSGADLLALLPRLGVAAAIAYGVMLIAWPWALGDPWRRPFEALATFGRFPLDTGVLVAGHWLRSTALPFYYLPLMLVVKVPVLHLALSAGLVMQFGAARRRLHAMREAGDTRWLAWAVTLIALLLPLAYALVSRPVLYDEMRHFLFLLPPLAVLGGVGAELLLRRFDRRGPVLRVVLALSAVIYLAAIGAALVRSHPYEYVNYNGLAGGIRGADQRFELDYWGTAQEALFAALKQRLRSEGGEAALHKPWRIRLCAAPEAGLYYMEPEWSPVWIGESGPADFELGRPGRACGPPHLPASIEVRRDGVLLGYVSDLRTVSP